MARFFLLFALLTLFITGDARTLVEAPPAAATAAGAACLTICPTAIFGFTDSLSDTGNRDMEANRTTVAGSLPYGITYGQATGRYSDGLVTIDFLSRMIGAAPLSPPSLSSNGSTFEGLNFGFAGATITPQGGNPYSSPHILNLQVQDFVEHRRTLEALNKHWSANRLSTLFSEALYYIEIGGDDINFAFGAYEPAYIVNTTIPTVVDTLRSSILRLFDTGARNFLVFNMPLAGCTPDYLSAASAQNLPASSFDEFGCLAAVNELARAFNNAVHNMLIGLRRQYVGNFLYYDWFATNLEFLQDPARFEFTNVLTACCGAGGGAYNCEPGSVLCSCNSAAVPCSNPSSYFSWDGIHQTQRFYQLTASAVVRGDHVDPPAQIVPGCIATQVLR